MSGRARKASEVSDLFIRAATRPDRRDDPDPGAPPDAGAGLGAGPRTGARPGARAYTRPGAGPQAGVGPDPYAHTDPGADEDAHADALAGARRGLDLTARQYARNMAELGKLRQKLTEKADALRTLGEDEELVRARVLIAGAPPEALQ